MLQGIERICPNCQKVFRYCQHCWRSHKYCGPSCSLEGRRKNRRATERKYAATDKGRENRRRRQKNFRIRRILEVRVTDQSSINIINVIDPRRTKAKNLNQCRRCERPIKTVFGGESEIPFENKREVNRLHLIGLRSTHDGFSFRAGR